MLNALMFLSEMPLLVLQPYVLAIIRKKLGLIFIGSWAQKTAVPNQGLCPLWDFILKCPGVHIPAVLSRKDEVHFQQLWERSRLQTFYK